MSYESAIQFSSLMESGIACMSNNRWKSSVQNFELLLLLMITELHTQLVSGTYKPKPTFNFMLNERGKMRAIKAHHIVDRTWYKSWVHHDLYPQVENRIMPNNSASQVGKGTDHAIKLFRQALAKAYRKWGTDFFVVTMDYHDYFGSIPHSMIPEVIDLSDPRSVRTLNQYIEVFPGDYGIGIGGEPSQVIAIVYPSSVDRGIVCNCPTLQSARYMDDSWAICHTLDEAKYTLDYMIQSSEKLGLQVNHDRTTIVNMNSSSVTWLKKRTHIDPNTGKIIMKLTRKNVRDRKRAIKYQYREVENGRMPRICAFNSIQCWSAYAHKYNSYEQLKLVVKLFSELFGVPDEIACKLLHKCNKGWIQLCQDANLL